MSHAFVYGTSGLATVYDGEQLWVFDLRQGNQPELVPNFHEKTRTLILGDSERVDDPGEHPYPAVYEKLRLEYMRDSLLRMILMSLDRKHSAGLRKRAAETALELLNENPVIRAWALDIFQKTPLPEVADFDGLSNERLKEFLAPFWTHAVR